MNDYKKMGLLYENFVINTEAIGDIVTIEDETYIETEQGEQRCLVYPNNIVFYKGQIIQAATKYEVLDVNFETKILTVKLLDDFFALRKGSIKDWSADEQAKIIRKLKIEGEESTNQRSHRVVDSRNYEFTTVADWGVLGILTDGIIRVIVTAGKHEEQFESDYNYLTGDIAKKYLNRGYRIDRNSSQNMVVRIELIKNHELVDYINSVFPIWIIHNYPTRCVINNTALGLSLFRKKFKIGNNSDHSNIEQILEAAPSTDHKYEYMTMWRLALNKRQNKGYRHNV